MTMSGTFSPSSDPAAAETAGRVAAWVDAINERSAAEADTGGVLTAILDRGAALLSLPIDHPDRQAAAEYFGLAEMPRWGRTLVVDALRVARRRHRPEQFAPDLARAA